MSKSNIPVWPSPENPYDKDFTFTDGKGYQITMDLKTYYPALLRVKIERHHAWEIVNTILHQIRYGKEIEFSLSGKIEETEDEL